MNERNRQKQSSYADLAVFNIAFVKPVHMENTDDIIGRILKNRYTRIGGFKELFNIFLVRVAYVYRVHINPRSNYFISQHIVKIKRVLKQVALLLVKHALVLNNVDNVFKIVLGNRVSVCNTAFPEL